VRGPFARIAAGWLGLAKKAGFLLLLVGGCAVLGSAIAWPLWYFATKDRAAFTVSVILLVCAGLAGLSVKGLLRRRSARRVTQRPPRSPLRVLLSILMAVLLLVGLYACALLFSRGLWVPALFVLIAWLALVGWIGSGHGAHGAR
jgi:hypothetical protein